MSTSIGFILERKSTHLAANQRVLIFLLLSIALITLPHANHIPHPVFSFFSVLLLWRFVGIWKTNYLPGNLLVFLLTVSAVVLLYTQHQGILGRNAGTSIFVTALGLKLMEIKKQRDLYLVCYLAFIVASSQFLFQQNILMAGYILLVCWFLLSTLVFINSHKPESFFAVKTAGIITLQALPLCAVFFVLFPRLEAPRWIMFDDPNAAKTGLSDSLEPGSISSLGLSDELVFRVKFKGKLPPANQRYWRGPVYSHTDGQRWTESKKLFFHPSMDKTSYKGQSYQYTLLMEPQLKHWVFALDMPSSHPHMLKKNSQYQLINTENPNKRSEYQITSFAQYNTGYITKTELKKNLQLPTEPSEKIKHLVTQLNGFDRPAAFFIQSLLHYIKTEKFHYTLKPPLMTKNPIETFLFESRYGFCSHYATAFVYLMRVAGIPARVVGGYQGGEINRLGGFLEIRQANAHAWTEVWLENKGWTRIDPTAAIAPERVEQDINIDLQIATGNVYFQANANQAMSWLKRAKQAWSNIDYNWQRWVINYNNINQSKFLSSFGIDNIQSMINWLIASITFITCILARFILKVKHIETDKTLLLYQRFCKKLAKKGLRKKNGETALHFSRRIQQQRPDLTVKANKITSLYLNLRYGKYIIDKELEVLKKEVSNFKA